MLKEMVSLLESALLVRIACRSEPAPLSFVLVTTRSAGSGGGSLSTMVSTAVPGAPSVAPCGLLSDRLIVLLRLGILLSTMLMVKVLLDVSPSNQLSRPALAL